LLDAKKMSSQIEMASRQMMQKWVRIHGAKMVRFGFSVADVARFYDVSLQTVSRWTSELAESDCQRTSVRSGPGRPSKVSAAQMARIAAMVLAHTPDQLNLESGLWTMKLFARLIALELGLFLSRPTVANIMAQLGFVPSRPVHLVHQDGAGWCRHWEQAAPELWRRAKHKGARILLADESRLSGEYYIDETTSVRGAVRLISALSMTGELQFMLTQGEPDAQMFKTFLRQLMMGVERPILLAVDSCAMHDDPLIEEYVRAARGRLELCRVRFSDEAGVR
jgi:transposase